jgi:hypothetical protein
MAYDRSTSICLGELFGVLLRSLAAGGTNGAGLGEDNMRTCWCFCVQVGSPYLAQMIQSHLELLCCDYAVSADGGQISESQGGIPLGLRRDICSALRFAACGNSARMQYFRLCLNEILFY